MSNQKIELTPTEIEEIKDTAKFRTKVMLLLKQLNGVPTKITGLAVSQAFQWFFISMIILFLVWKR